MIFGGDGIWPPVVHAEDLSGKKGENGVRGFVINGVDQGEGSFSLSGTAVASADVDGNGLNDLVIGSPGVFVEGQQFVGRAHVLFGSESLGVGGVIDLDDIESSTGVLIAGMVDEVNPFPLLASSLSNGGDFNGDGLEDIVLGTAGLAATNGQSIWVHDEAYVVFGGEDIGETVDLTELNGVNGFLFQGSPDPFDRSESSRSLASGDVNGDGIADLIIGAPNAGPAGEVYVVFGIPRVGDCNHNAIPDACDITDGTSTDDNGNGIPDECECSADINGDGVVGPFDLALVLGFWGPCDGCDMDLDGDGIVGPFDLALVLGNWGPCD